MIKNPYRIEYSPKQLDNWSVFSEYPTKERRDKAFSKLISNIPLFKFRKSFSDIIVTFHHDGHEVKGQFCGEYNDEKTGEHWDVIVDGKPAIFLKTNVSISEV